MKAIKLKSGQQVTEPGIYDMPIETYHTQITDGPSLSSTGIRRLLKSPAHFWKHSELNPNRVEEDDKEAFILGRAAHHLLLGEREFDKHFIKAKYDRFQSDESKAWKQAQIDAGLTVLTATQIEKIRGMAGLLPWQEGMTNCGLKNTPIVAVGGALSGEIERSLFWKRGGVWLKSRPDAIPGDSNDFSDLKTVSSKSSSGVDDRTLSIAVFDRGYHVQGAMVGMGSSAVLLRQMEGFHLIFVDTGDVHAVATKTLDETDLIDGERAVDVAIGIFQKCLATNIWPGPTAAQADAQKLAVPAWGREQFTRHLDRLEQEFAL